MLQRIDITDLSEISLTLYPTVDNLSGNGVYLLTYWSLNGLLVLRVTVLDIGGKSDMKIALCRQHVGNSTWGSLRQYTQCWRRAEA